VSLTVTVKRVSYGANGWQAAGVFTQARRIVLQNLTPGTTYNIQARAIGGSTGSSDWSDPVSHMALQVEVSWKENGAARSRAFFFFCAGLANSIGVQRGIRGESSNAPFLVLCLVATLRGNSSAAFWNASKRRTAFSVSILCLHLITKARGKPFPAHFLRDSVSVSLQSSPVGFR